MLRQKQTEIATQLQRWAWAGSRIDEATHLVLVYCDAPFPSTFAFELIDRVAFAPSIGRVFAHGDDGIAELTEDFCFVRTFETPFLEREIEYHPILKCIVGVGGQVRSVVDDRFGQRVDDNCFALSRDVQTFCVDSANGDIFLWAGNSNLFQFDPVTGRLRIHLLERIPQRVFRIFARAGIVFVEQTTQGSQLITVYDATTRQHLYNLNGDRLVLFFDPVYSWIFSGRRGVVFATDTSRDAKYVAKFSCYCLGDGVARLSSGILVRYRFSKEALFLSELVSS